MVDENHFAKHVEAVPFVSMVVKKHIAKHVEAVPYVSMVIKKHDVKIAKRTWLMF